MCINAKKFSKETDPYLLAGYLLPLVWFILCMNSFLDDYIKGAVLAGLLMICSAVYFGGWHFLRKNLNQEKHIALYLGGFISIVLAITKLHPELHHFDGPALATIAFVFGGLYFTKPLIEREMVFYVFAVFGTLISLWHINDLALPSIGVFSGTTLVLIYSLLPFLLGYFFPCREGEPTDVRLFRTVCSYLAGAFILVLLFLDLIQIQGIPRSFLFFTLPAALCCYFSTQKSSDSSKLTLAKTTLILSVLGFFSTFVIIIDRFNPFPEDVMVFSSSQSLVGFMTIAILTTLSWNVNKVRLTSVEVYDKSFDSVWQFMLTLFLYVSLWSTITHEIMALFNSINLHAFGLRSFATTIWWACLGAYMIFVGVKDETKVNQKNIGFGLLSLTIAKILFVDLVSLNTNFKVFVFMLVGMLMLYISYVANKKEQTDEEQSKD
jgi:hypothetical protein